MEIITYLGSFIRSDPSFFVGIMRIRVHFFIIAMREEVSRVRGCDEEGAIEYLMQCSPCEMKALLGQVLTAHEPSTINADHVSLSFVERFAQNNVPSSHLQSSVTLEMDKVLPNPLVLSCQSGGFKAGNFATIHISRDGQAQLLPLVHGRGLNVVVVNRYNGTVMESFVFDTHISKEESHEFERLIAFLENGTVVLIVAKDDCFENLESGAKAAIESLGSTLIHSLGYRDSWCLIGQKGTQDPVPESLSKAGATELITRVIDLNEHRCDYSPTKGTEDEIENHSLFKNIVLPSSGRWLRKRKNDGALNRVPKGTCLPSVF